MRAVETGPRTRDALSNAGAEAPWEELVGVRFPRPTIEALFAAAQQEAGLAPDEVRSGVGCTTT